MSAFLTIQNNTIVFFSNVTLIFEKHIWFQKKLLQRRLRSTAPGASRPPWSTSTATAARGTTGTRRSRSSSSSNKKSRSSAEIRSPIFSLLTYFLLNNIESFSCAVKMQNVNFISRRRCRKLRSTSSRTSARFSRWSPKASLTIFCIKFRSVQIHCRGDGLVVDSWPRGLGFDSCYHSSFPSKPELKLFRVSALRKTIKWRNK